MLPTPSNSLYTTSPHLFTVTYIIYVPGHMFTSRLGMRRIPASAFTCEMLAFRHLTFNGRSLQLYPYLSPLVPAKYTCRYKLTSHVAEKNNGRILVPPVRRFPLIYFAISRMEMWNEPFSTIVFVVVLSLFHWSLHKEANTFFLNIIYRYVTYIYIYICTICW